MSKTTERNISFGVTVKASVHKQLIMQALEADMAFQDWFREFIQDGLATLPELEIEPKKINKTIRKERLAGR